MVLLWLRNLAILICASYCVSVSGGCCNKHLLSDRHLLPPSPGGWKFKVKVPVGLVPPCVLTWSCPWGCRVLISSYKNTHHIGVGPAS